MELEFFVKPGEDEEWHQKWVEDRLDWWVDQGVERNSLQLYNVPPDELAHYSKATFDVMYQFPHGLEELEGIANRTDFDLGSHTKAQGDSASLKVMENPIPTPSSPSAIWMPTSGSCLTSSSPLRVSIGACWRC